MVEIAGSLAETMRLSTGDLVRVRVGDRSLVAPVHASPAIHPGVVAIALGQGHTAYGRYARDRGQNAFDLLDASADEEGFLMSANDVGIEKATGP